MALYRNIGVVLTANGRGLTTGLRAATGEVQGFTRAVESAGTRAAKSTAAFTAFRTAALVAAGALAYTVHTAAQFDNSMRNVNSLLQVNEAQFGAMEKSVLSLSRTTPQGAKSLADGLYDIASSGFEGSNALNVLKQSAFAATAGMSTTATSVRAIAAVLNAYGLKASDAQAVSDTLFQTVNLGVVSFDELASNLGDVVAAAAAAKVPIGEVGSALAAMTLSGVTGAESVTSLNRLLQQTVNPGKNLTAALHSLGFESGQAALDTLGLHGVMELLRKTTGGSSAEIRKLFPDIRAARGAFTLMAASGANYNRVFGQINNTTITAGATQRAFNEQMKSATNQLHLLMNQANAVAITVGLALIPRITDGVKAIQSFAHEAAPTVAAYKPLLDTLGQIIKFFAVLGGSSIGLVAKGFAGLPTPIQEAAIALLLFTSLRPRFAAMVGETTRLRSAVTSLQKTIGVGKGATDAAFASWEKMTPAMRRLGVAADSTSAKMGNLARGTQVASRGTGLLARAGSGLLGALGGPWGLAISGAVVGLSLFASAHAKAKAKQEELTQAIIADSGAIGDNTKEWVVNSLTKSGVFDQAKKLGIGIDLVTRAALGSIPAITEMNAQLDAWDRSHPLRGQGDVGRIGQTDSLRASVLGTGNALTDAQSKAQDYATAMGAVGGALANTASGTKAATGATREMSDALAEMKASADASAAAAAHFDAVLKQIVDRKLGLRSTARDFQQALDDLSESAKKNGHSLDITTQKGRDNQEAFDHAVGAAVAFAQKQRELGVDTDIVRNKLIGNRKALIDVATQFFGSREAARRYVNALLKIPPKKPTEVSTPGLQRSIRWIQTYNTELGKIPSTINTTVQTFRQGERDSQTSSGGSGGNPNRKDGGLLTGPGTGTSDSIPLMASNGEFIINAASTAANRGALNYINNGGQIDRYASGGEVRAQRRENARLRLQARGGGDATLEISFDSSSAIGGAQSYYDTRGQAAAQLRANQTRDPNDSAEDYFRKTRITANGYTGVLNKSLAATRIWGGQLGKIANTVGGDVSSSLERMGEAGKDAVAAMARATTKDAKKMADALRALDFAHFAADIGNEAAGRAAFQANLIALVKMGRSDLASQLAQMGYESGGSIAAAAVRASGSQLASLASKIASINNSSDDSIAQSLQIAAALAGSGGKLGIVGVSKATGIDIGDVLTLIGSHDSDIFSKLPGGAMTQVRLDQALINSGKQPSGLRAGGIVTGANTGLYYRWAEPGGKGESLIPHDGGPRSRALWEQTGRILGASPSAANTGGSVSFTLSPQISVRVDRAGASAEEIAQVTGDVVDSKLMAVVSAYKAGSH